MGFPPPRGFAGTRLCDLTGSLATAACPHVTVEHLRPGRRDDIHACMAHVSLAIDRRDGLLATSETPPEHLRRRTFTDLGPRFAAWQVANGLPFPPTASSPGSTHRPRRSRATPNLHITSPRHTLRLMRDPETPADRSTIALEVVVDPPREQVVWYVDGEPFEVADHPFTVRWPLENGTHSFQARLPYEPGSSQVVRVTVD